MKIDIILAGVGGQGILSIASIIGYAAVKKGLYLKQAEVHGMSQRGGDVQSHFRLADYPIASDLIPRGKADLIISVEPMESLRYLPWLSREGTLITNDQPFINIPDYPSAEILQKTFDTLPRKVVINANDIAKELGSERSANMVILGAAAPFIHIDFADLENAVRDVFARKGEAVVNTNLACLNAGQKFTENILKFA
ncbi:MAG: indolepyruvate oxidoreductase subunit beta [Bacteroidales bacterium]|jgi:indolepyruvate ferredoxin oxidoreductase beta subunit|nr:indolepyruvate oxidoreductase subunit beta [Bacteroidales bacterium]